MDTGYPYQTDDEPNNLMIQASRLVFHLERISADSHHAHRGSGIRGALLKELARIEVKDGQDQAEPGIGLERLEHLVDMGSRILVGAAREVPER